MFSLVALVCLGIVGEGGERGCGGDGEGVGEWGVGSEEWGMRSGEWMDG